MDVCTFVVDDVDDEGEEEMGEDEIGDDDKIGEGGHEFSELLLLLL